MAGDHTLSYSDTPGGYVPGGYLSIPRDTSPGTKPGDALSPSVGLFGAQGPHPVLLPHGSSTSEPSVQVPVSRMYLPSSELNLAHTCVVQDLSRVHPRQITVRRNSDRGSTAELNRCLSRVHPRQTAHVAIPTEGAPPSPDRNTSQFGQREHR